MRFRSFDNLRLFDVVSQHLSFTAAAEELHLTKGAVSYQIAKLEEELGFKVFERQHRGIVLTEKGHQLWQKCHLMFMEFEEELEILRRQHDLRVTIATSTYFASRWLSSRLMNFLVVHPEIRLQISPLIDLTGTDSESADIVVRWGNGGWGDAESELLFPCPAFATASQSTAEQVGKAGLEATMDQATLLHDRADSLAWQDWFQKAGMAFRPQQSSLTIPDPNVRVQAVINGQGIAINDALVNSEIERDELRPIGGIRLQDYGYFLVYPHGVPSEGPLAEFRQWLYDEASTYLSQGD